MVTSFDQTLGTPPLTQAIDRDPLIVAPETRLSEVAALMYQTAHLDLKTSIDTGCGARSSCVLVMREQQILGIFTERDLVRLTALKIPMHSTCIAEVMHAPVLSMTEAALQNVFAALFLFRRHRIRHLAIVNSHDQLVGVISLDSIRHILRPTNLLKIRRVAEVMTQSVIVAPPTASILQLTELMSTHRISCVVIVEAFPDDEVQHPVGIVTERDIVRFQACGMEMHQTLAQTVMSTPLFVLNPEDSLWTAHQEMEHRQVRRLVVSWNWGRNLGIITQTSLLKVFDPIEMHDVIETLQRTLQQLGLDPNQILASRDQHPDLPTSFDLADSAKMPIALTTFQTQIEYLIDTPHLAIEARQAVLLAMSRELQQIRHFLER